MDVIPTHTPFIAKVAGSETQCTCGLPWGGAERGKERQKKRGDKATVNPNIRLELDSPSNLSPASQDNVHLDIIALEWWLGVDCPGMVGILLGRNQHQVAAMSGKQGTCVCSVIEQHMRCLVTIATLSLRLAISLERHNRWENRCQERIRTGG